MVAATHIDWTTVIVAGLAGVPSLVAAILSFVIHRNVSTPSGDSIGAVAERSHELGIANNLLLRRMNGVHEEGEQS